MKKKVKIFLSIMVFVSMGYGVRAENGFSDDKHAPSLLSDHSTTPVIKRLSDSIYNLISLGSYGLEKEVFFSAYKGYQYLLSKGSLTNTNLLTICDYSQSSNRKRLYVVDLASSRLLYNTYVSHGRNSGGEYATSFSNLRSSNKSSLGFLVTAGTYYGKAGLSMRFKGIEPGINDQVGNRDIVLHGSRFVNEGTMNLRGTIGQSLGCPAVPVEYHQKIINLIKGGSCYYAHYPDSWYMHTSRILNAPFNLPPVASPNISAVQSADAHLPTGEEASTTASSSN